MTAAHRARHADRAVQRRRRASRALLADYPGEVAAIIVEPVVGNMGVVRAVAGVPRRSCASLATRDGALLIFDEVMTGFRVARGGAQERYGVTPDLTTLGKIIGGGLPVGAYGGRRDLMTQISPAGPGLSGGHDVGQPARDGRRPGDARRDSQQRGVLRPARNARPAARGRRRAYAWRRAETRASSPGSGSMWTLFFTSDRSRTGRWPPQPIARDSDGSSTRCWHRGISLAPSQFEANFISAAHTRGRRANG